MEFTKESHLNFLNNRAAYLNHEVKLLSGKQNNENEIFSFIGEGHEEAATALTTFVFMARQNIKIERCMIEKEDRQLKNLYKKILAKAIAEVEGM